MRRIKDTSIQHLAIGVVLFLNLLSLAVIIITFVSLSDKGVEIDVSGRNRMLSQRMVLFANLYVNGDEDARKIVLEAMNLHEASLKAMKKGGEAPGMKGAKLKTARGNTKQKLNDVEAFWKTYKANVAIVVNEPLYWKDKKLNPEVLNSLDFLNENTSKMLKINNDLVKAYVAQSHNRGVNISFFLTICVIFNLITLLTSYFMVRAYIVKPIQHISKISNKLVEGDYEQKLLEESKNEIGTLATSLNMLFGKFKTIFEYIEQLADKKYIDILDEKNKYLENNKIINALLDTSSKLRSEEELKNRQNWIDMGLSQFSDLMRNNANDLQALTQAFISKTCAYIEIPQGAVFVLQDEKEDTKFLELTSAYAIPKDKILKNKIHIRQKSAEGLIGQVFLENSKLIINNAENASISSGMGEAKTKFVALLPIYTGEETLGVLELVSFKEFEDYQISFIEKITSDLAITINTLRANLETERLYKESQNITKQMLQQEDNMRQEVEQITASYIEVEMQLTESREKLRNSSILNQVVKIIEKHLDIPEFLEEVRQQIPSAFSQQISVRITYKDWLLEDQDMETSDVLQEEFFQDISYQNGKIEMYDLRGSMQAGFFKIDQITFLQNISTLIEGYINTRLGQNEYKNLNNAQKKWQKEREQLVFDLENTLTDYEKVKKELDIIQKNENNKIKAFKKKEKDLLIRIAKLEKLTNG